jgi:hypothetical protein
VEELKIMREIALVLDWGVFFLVLFFIWNCYLHFSIRSIKKRLDERAAIPAKTLDR